MAQASSKLIVSVRKEDKIVGIYEADGSSREVFKSLSNSFVAVIKTKGQPMFVNNFKLQADALDFINRNYMLGGVKS